MWDNTPPNPFLPELIRRWNDEQRGPRIRYATFDDLRERVLRVPDSEVTTLRGDWTDYWSFGAGSTFDTAGHVVALDDDQLPGSSRGWVTVESVATMWDRHSAVALLTPDAPLVQFGGFHFGPPPDAVHRDPDPLLLSWVANNYWDTNFAQVQNGRVKLRYGLLTLAEPDAAEIASQAVKLRSPVLTWPVTTGGRSPSAGKL
jgi:hypothetical protein